MKGIAAAATPNIVTTATDVAADTSVSMANVAEEARGSTPSQLPKKAKAREYQTGGDTRRCLSTQQRKSIMGLRTIGLRGGRGAPGVSRGVAGCARRGQPESAMSTLLSRRHRSMTSS